ncbi:MAG: MarR family transcriptional regulator [Chloroflexota bacterium]|nr:MarR family transcriptional regulator [Chloroflexota bacterium]
MQTQREQIIAYLRDHPEGADDAHLVIALRISRHQTVNQICRALLAAGLISRDESPQTHKKVNRLVVGAIEVPQSLMITEPPLPVASVSTLEDDTSVRAFAYHGEKGLSEDNVKAAVAAVLQVDGWETDIRWRHIHGIDIAASRGDERLILEAKGEGSRNPMRVNYFLGALGELLQRMESPNVRYGIAVPAHRQFVGLILRLPIWVRSHLNLCFYLVRQTDAGEYEVGYIPPVITTGRTAQT